jgi:6-pyruvoyltetrahydropterin/6-carboxytetrahydropterin synthase
MEGFMKVYKEFRFEAAHRLPLVPEGHKCKRLHGHSYRVRITIKGKVNELGWVCDFGDIKKAFAPLIFRLDHSYLNDIEGLENPTCENVAVWIWNRIALAYVSEIDVSECAGSGCIYNGGL